MLCSLYEDDEEPSTFIFRLEMQAQILDGIGHRQGSATCDQGRVRKSMQPIVFLGWTVRPTILPN